MFRTKQLRFLEADIPCDIDVLLLTGSHLEITFTSVL